MNFSYSPHCLSDEQKRLERLLQIVPGAISWAIILGTIALSIAKPLIAAALIIVFDVYWIFRLFYMNIFLTLSYAALSSESAISWEQRLKDTRNIDQALERLKNTRTKGLAQMLSLMNYRRQLLSLKKNPFPDYESIYQLVIFPIAREGREIVEPGIKSMLEGDFPAKKMLLVLAVEERSDDSVKIAMEQLAYEYRENFFGLLLCFHPDDLPNESRVKGANASYAARRGASYFQEKNIPFENIIVSCFDSDTVVGADYFNCLTFTFMATPSRTQASYQPIPVYQNNIWEAPAFARVLDIGSSFFQLIEATNPERLVSFSSHSMSFKALVDVGYWPVDMISDDSAIFWKSYIHFDGKYKVVPLSTTLSMDITQSNTWRKTFVSVYKQKRRWAWGVENFPIVMRAFLKSSSIPLSQKLQHGFKLLEGHISWATWSFLLTFIGWLPAIFAQREFSRSVLYYTGPRITTAIFSLASIGLINCVILSLLLLPGNTRKNTFFNKTKQALQWLLLPAVMVFLSGTPALDAQTRLMFGRRLEFWVTSKERKG